MAGVAATVAPVGELPAEVRRSGVGVPPSVAGRPWRLPIGVADDDLGPAVLPVWEGEHVLVAGPGRSGRTSALAVVAEAVRVADPSVPVVAVAGRRSWLGSVPGVAAVSVAELAGFGSGVVLVDDADAVDDVDGVLEGLAGGRSPEVVLVAAGRSEALRSAFGHWTRAVRRSRLGVLLRPNLDLDGELLGTPLPRRVSVPMVAGRGFLVADGVARLAQLAMPDEVARSGP